MRWLVARYDVTGLSEKEIGQLALEVAVQAERSEGHPPVQVETRVEDDDVDGDDPIWAMPDGRENVGPEHWVG